ncbi:MAG: DUF6473 family protein [Pseudomonadota bacterium]
MLDSHSRGGLHYQHCYYGSSRLAFRGPEVPLDGDYVAVLGGNATFGKFVPQPYPELLDKVSGIRTVNLGCMHAGMTAFVDDPSLIDICSHARATIIQITGAHCLDNVFYSLHPRRNDRFIDATARLRALYPDVDFTEFHFVRHMLSALYSTAPDAFLDVVDALKHEWVMRTRDLVRQINGPVVLFWMADRGPDMPNTPIADQLRYDDPLFVDREMIDAVRRDATDVVMAIASDTAQNEGLAGKIFSDFERPAAMRMPGPLWHAEAATALFDVVTELVPSRPKPRPRVRPEGRAEDRPGGRPIRASRSARGPQ